MQLALRRQAIRCLMKQIFLFPFHDLNLNTTACLVHLAPSLNQEMSFVFTVACVKDYKESTESTEFVEYFCKKGVFKPDIS